MCIYRISDASQSDLKKSKLGGGNKMKYLENFISVFGTKHLYIVADCVSDSTHSQLVNVLGTDAHITRTSYKSAGFSFLHSILWLFEMDYGDEHVAYIVEDDHIHLPLAPKALHEGLCLADYVTLYDHPDKYDETVYPNGEETIVLTSDSLHWRTTQSTVLTVSARIKTLKNDLPTFLHYCQYTYAHDHQMFWALKLQGRCLISAIPALSTHAEVGQIALFRNWDVLLACRPNSVPVENAISS